MEIHSSILRGNPMDRGAGAFKNDGVVKSQKRDLATKLPPPLIIYRNLICEKVKFLFNWKK